MKSSTCVRLLSAAAIFVTTPVLAQDAPPADPATAPTNIPDPAPADAAAQAVDNEQIVVTGVARGRNRLDASVSTTSISSEEILNSAPRSAAELLRGIPGIRAESSGGDGNANINVRGLPVSTGGAKFL